MGIVQDFRYEENTVALEPGSTIVFYTDGVVEAEKEDNELFEMDRFCQILQNNTFRNAEEVTNEVFNKVREFAGENPQSDDITCLVLRTKTE